MLVELIAAATFSLLIWWGFTENPAPLFGIYSQPGEFFTWKKFLFWILLKLRQRKRKLHDENAEDGKVGGYGRKSRNTIADMEAAQKLDPHPDAIDTMYFTSVGKDGSYCVLRIARRHERRAEIWLSMKLPDIGVLQSPVHPDTTIYNTDGKNFSAGGLTFECIEPMRRWKILFNGLLRKGLWNDYDEKNKGETVHVKFSFIWEAFSDFFDFDVDIDPGVLADAVAREPWTRDFFENLRGKHQSHYEQWGEMLGSVYVEGYEERKIYFKCMHNHSYGVRDWRDFYRYIIHFFYLEDGTAFQITSVSLPTTLSHLKTGYVALPCGVVVPVTFSSLEMPQIAEDGTPRRQYSFIFKAGGKSYNVEINMVDPHEIPNYYHHDDWRSIIHECFSTINVNGVKGWGIAEHCYRYAGGSTVPTQHSITLLKEYDIDSLPESDHRGFVLPFTSPQCTSSKLVGGKGCQLALLTQLNSKEFTVPVGMCLTIASFEHEMSRSEELIQAVERLAAISSGRVADDLKVSCEKTVQLFQNAQMNEEIQAELKNQMEKTFGTEGFNDKLFAVRSSAAGEDSAEMSAAGQMETILGVKGIQKIFGAVCKCWASHFAFQAVEYRRQHGQPIRSSVAVVIQEMVSSEASGVLFTQDPLTQNPAVMTINANYGLGESVVSGSAEPDTIQITRTWDDRLTIRNIELGRKSTHVTLKDGGGIAEEEVESAASRSCCLGEDVILKLANIGVQLEKHFADPRDIEWAVRDGQIYLLQARPITTIGVESDWQLMHEFDTPLASDSEALTTCNIGEMMPGAMTPLTISTFYRAVEFAFQDMLKKSGVLEKHYDLHRFLALQCNIGFINMCYTYGLTEVHVQINDKRSPEMSLMGETIESITKDDVVKYWGKSPLYKRLFNSVKMFLLLRGAYKKTLQWESVAETYSLGNHSDPLSLYNTLNERLPEFFQFWTDTFQNSASSASWSSILLSILSQGKPEWTMEHMSDVAMLLAKCENVYSADVPSALQNFAKQIQDSGKAGTLRNMTPEEAVSWLQSEESGDLGTFFARFLDRQGHRCIREAEMSEKSWKSEPEKVVKVVQVMLQSPMPQVVHKEVEDVETSIKKLKSQVTFVGRKIMKWVLPKARVAVGRREWGKSICVQLNEVFKQGYWLLADMMVKEGYLPETELLFFLTHKEIGTVLRQRSGRLIAKAQRRRRLLSKQMALKYPRLSFGHPKPVEEMKSDVVLTGTGAKLKGMPVSQGKMQGVCRVVLSLQDAASIQPGDILVVNYTDVGWSPYFPLISGLVTEIGGLLSHGAVVAREYGLPCIVNVQRATSLLKTGDTVIVDGTQGIIEKLE